MMDRGELLKVLAQHRKDEVVLYTSAAVKDWPLYSDNPLDFYVSLAMGFGSSLGVGVALTQPRRRVWVIDGDGCVLMNLGALVTISELEPPNLVHFVLNNGLWEMPGRVALPGEGKTSLTAFARAAGLRKVYEYEDLAALQKALDSLLREPGPLFINLKVAPGPRDAITVEKARAFTGPGEQARALRRILSGGHGS